MLTVRTYGNTGPLLVLLHGGPGAAGYMVQVARGLADSYRIVEPFQRGSGPDPLTVARHIEDLREVLRSYDAEPSSAILGSCWGAMLALAYAATHSASVGPLILVGCGTFDVAARARLHEIIELRRSETLRRFLERVAQIDDEDARLQATADAEMPIYSYDVQAPLEVETYDARALRETWNDMLALQDSGVYPASFAAIGVPVLMLHGAFDPHPGQLIRDSLQRHIPQLEYVELERCGHYPWLERAVSGQFLTLVKDWLRKHAAVSDEV